MMRTNPWEANPLQPTKELKSNIGDFMDRRRALAWSAARWVFAFLIAVTFIRTPRDGFIAQNMVLWEPVRSANILLGWNIVSDILLSTLLSFLLASMVLWNIAKKGIANSNKIERASFRFIDIAWYLGSAVALAVTISELQSGWAARQQQELRSQYAWHMDRDLSLRQSVEEACVRFDEIGPVSPSTDLMAEGIAVAKQFCGHKVWLQDPFGVSLDTVCAEVNPPPKPRIPRRSYSRWYQAELLRQRELFDALNFADSFCLNNIEILQVKSAIDAIEEMEELGADMTQPFDWIWYFRLFSILIGFRLFRSAIDFKEELIRATQDK